MQLTDRALASLAALPLLAVMASPLSADPGFVLGWNLPAGASAHGVALGDIDGDLDVDAYVADFYHPDVLWLNDGTGQFTRSAQVLGDGYDSCPLLAPLDADGSLDLWLTRHLQSGQVWLNDGSGTLTDSGQSIGGSISRRGGVLGDLDGDLDLDAFIATDDSGSSNEVFLNNGSGVFTSSAQSLGSYFSRAVALGDVDGDLDLDAMIGNNGANKLWQNDGTGTFSDSGQTVGTEGTFDVALGDLDGDVDLDAFFANGSLSGDPEEVWLNDGDGNFSDSGQELGDDYSFSVELLDCDDDDDLDAVVGNNIGLPNRLYLNDGDGGFTESAQALGNGGAIGVAVSDLDGDLDLDLFFANVTQPSQVFFDTGSCVFTNSGALLGGSAAESVALGDVDGDDDLDALVGTYGGIVRLFVNDGTGAFTDANLWWSSGHGPTANAVQLADFDGDGDLDAWIGLCCSGGVANDDPADRLLVNNGSGVFTESAQLLGSEYTAASAVGDVDGDSDLDIVVANFPSLFSPGTNRIYRNNGSGIFTQGMQALGTGNHTAVALGDIDGDLDLDLLFGVRGAGSTVWRNGGNGLFVNTGQALGSANTYAVALADLDGDGDRDAYLGNEAADTVWINDGTGVFSDSGQALGSLSTPVVHLLDVDGDGDLDVWATNEGQGAFGNQVWLNDGAGVFTDSTWSLGVLAFAASALGDVDGNGAADVFLASFDGDHQVWLNQLTTLIFADDFESGNDDSWDDTLP